MTKERIAIMKGGVGYWEKGAWMVKGKPTRNEERRFEVNPGA